MGVVVDNDIGVDDENQLDNTNTNRVLPVCVLPVPMSTPGPGYSTAVTPDAPSGHI